MTGAGRIVVAMLTFRRPEDLAVAVPAFLREASSVGDDVRLMVVDNDPDGSARAYVTGLADARVVYVQEPRPGIAVARNRALDEADGDVLVFVDDDERPTRGWLGHLVDVFRSTNAVAVVGPVVSEFAGDPEPWVRAGRFFDRRRMPTGTPVDVAATNNLLLDLATVRRLGLRFDPEFGLSGGSDTLFTRSLARHGSMVWCDEAVVVDVVPSARTTRAWVLRRARRSGNSAARVALRLTDGPVGRARVRVTFLARGLVRIAGGALRVAYGVLSRSLGHRARGRRSVARGVGMVTGAVGHVVYEYRRT